MNWFLDREGTPDNTFGRQPNVQENPLVRKAAAQQRVLRGSGVQSPEELHDTLQPVFGSAGPSMSASEARETFFKADPREMDDVDIEGEQALALEAEGTLGAQILKLAKKSFIGADGMMRSSPDEDEEAFQKAEEPAGPAAFQLTHEFLGQCSKSERAQLMALEKATPIGGTTPNGYKKVAPGQYVRAARQQVAKSEPVAEHTEVPLLKSEYGIMSRTIGADAICMPNEAALRLRRLGFEDMGEPNSGGRGTTAISAAGFREWHTVRKSGNGESHLSYTDTSRSGTASPTNTVEEDGSAAETLEGLDAFLEKAEAPRAPRTSARKDSRRRRFEKSSRAPSELLCELKAVLESGELSSRHRRKLLKAYTAAGGKVADLRKGKLPLLPVDPEQKKEEAEEEKKQLAEVGIKKGKKKAKRTPVVEKCATTKKSDMTAKSMDQDETAGADVKAKVMAFLKKNPKPEDEQVHALAEKLGMEHDDLEEVIYSMLAKQTKKSFDELDEFLKASGVPGGKKAEDAEEDEDKLEPDEDEEEEEKEEKAQPSDSADISPEKARQILHDGTVHGKPITEQQRKFFGAIGGHLPAPKTKKGMKKGEAIPGGKAKGKNPSDFDPEQLAAGTKVEMEHTPDKKKAREIAMDHLMESPDYYKELARMEAKLESKEKSLDSAFEDLEAFEKATPVGGTTPGGYKKVAEGKYVKQGTAKKPQQQGGGAAHHEQKAEELDRQYTNLIAQANRIGLAGVGYSKIREQATKVDRQAAHHHQVAKLYKEGADEKKIQQYLKFHEGVMAKSDMDPIEVLDNLEKAAGPFIGPKGGKWADAAHTIPWKEAGAKKKPAKKKAAKPKKRKLAKTLVKPLQAAAKRGIVGGGMDATFNQYHKLLDQGLIEHKGAGAATITEKGKKALETGSYEVGPSVLEAAKQEAIAPKKKNEAGVSAKDLEHARKKLADHAELVAALRQAKDVLHYMEHGEHHSSYPESEVAAAKKDLVEARKKVTEHRQQAGKELGLGSTPGAQRDNFARLAMQDGPVTAEHIAQYRGEAKKSLDSAFEDLEAFEKGLGSRWYDEYAGTPFEAEALAIEHEHLKALAALDGERAKQRKAQENAQKKYDEVVKQARLKRDAERGQRLYAKEDNAYSAYDGKRRDLNLKYLEYRRKEAQADAKRMEEGTMKGNNNDNLEPLQKSEFDELDDFIEKSGGRGGMPEGEVPTSMPSTQRPVDGGQLAGKGTTSGASDAGASTIQSTANAPKCGSAKLSEDDDEETKQMKDGKKPLEQSVSRTKKSLDYNDMLNKATEGSWEQQTALADTLAGFTDVLVGGIPSQPDEIQKSEGPTVAERSKAWCQKGGMVLYDDLSDVLTEDYMEKGQFYQPQNPHPQGMMHKSLDCPECGQRTPATLSDCQTCGADLQKAFGDTSEDGEVLPSYEQHGYNMQVEEDVLKSLSPGEDESEIEW